jgi:hypothetical protein
MARSTYIYIVMGPNGGEHDEPWSAFTVKHELVTYVARHSGSWKRSSVSIWRVQDGKWARKAPQLVTSEIYRLADELEMEDF